MKAREQVEEERRRGGGAAAAGAVEVLPSRREKETSF